MKWIEDIESALGQKLSTKGAIKSFDVLTNERILTRRFGWLLRSGVGAVLSDYDGSKGKPAVEMGAEYHYPLSNNTQFSNEFIATAVIDNDQSYNLKNNLSITHELSDRIDWENIWLLDYSNFENTNNVVTNTLSSTYRYYISNALSFNVTAKLTDIEDDITGNGNDEIDKSLLMGVTYRLK